MTGVLVTGVAGFIGFHVATALVARGERVIGIDDLNDYYDPALKRGRLDVLRAQAGDRLRFVQADFADPDALDAAVGGAAFDRIVHLGAQAGVRYSIDRPLVYGRSNLVGHLNILELARARRTAQLVYASSSSVYGGNTSLPFRVGDPVEHPVSLYAATKRANELMSETYSHLYRLPQTGLRFFTVYGPWGRPDMALWLFTQAVLEGRPIRVFNEGRMQRDFTCIDDIVAGVIAALDRPAVDDGRSKPGGSVSPHAIYNLGNHQPEPLGKLIDLIEAACGRPAVRDLQPMQPGDVPATFADIEDAARDLDFRPSVPLEDGVPRFVGWYRDYAAG